MTTLDSDFVIFAILVAIFLTGLFLAWFFSHRARVKERMMLIEKGIDISNLPQIGEFKFKFKFPWLKIGIVITGAAFGVVLGGFLEALQLFQRPEGSVPMLIRGGMLPLIFLYLFGGIGMILAYFLDKPKAQQ